MTRGYNPSVTGRIFTFLSAASFILLGVASLLWMQSYVSPQHEVYGSMAGGLWTVNSTRGRLWVLRERQHFFPPEADAILTPGDAHRLFLPGLRLWRQHDYARKRYPGLSHPPVPDAIVGYTPPSGPVTTRYFVAVRYWLACGLLLPLPMIWIARHARQSRVRQREGAGLCRVCGYDLRASGARCPECGSERAIQ